MAIKTFSIFYYGLEITSENNILNFLEPNAGNVELVATIDPGTYVYSDLLTKIKTAMDAVGDETYTITIDRPSKQITITGTDTFELLIGTGAQKGLSPFALLGFTGSIDLTGSSAYISDSESGRSYSPQFQLQDYTPAGNFKKRQDASVNQSASGLVETISFGLVGFFKMSFNFITDLIQDGNVIKTNTNGISDMNSFMVEITKKGQFEFMPDMDDRDAYHKVILESVSGSKDGTGYELKELVAQNLPGYYKLTGIVLREIEL